MKAAKIYFVLYIVLITEILIVISERDNAIRKISGQMAALDKLNITKHEEPITISIPQDTSTYVLPNQWTSNIFTSIILVPENLVSQSELDSVILHIDIDRNSPIPPFWPEGGLDSRTTTKVINGTNTKYAIYQNGKYCKFSVNIKLNDITNHTNGQNSLLAKNDLKYEFKTYIETPRIISNDFSVKSQEKILDGLSDPIKIKFLRSLPDSSEINNIRIFLSKEILTKKDTTRFLNSLKNPNTIKNTKRFLNDFRKFLLRGN